MTTSKRDPATQQRTLLATGNTEVKLSLLGSLRDKMEDDTAARANDDERPPSPTNLLDLATFRSCHAESLSKATNPNAAPLAQFCHGWISKVEGPPPIGSEVVSSFDEGITSSHASVTPLLRQHHHASVRSFEYNNVQGGSQSSTVTPLRAPQPVTPPSKRRRHPVKRCPEKIMEMLVEESEEDPGISWLPGGDGFKVDDPDAFLEKCAHRGFRFTKMESFERQMRTNYGFERKKGNTYRHELFHRDHPEKCEMIEPKQRKGTKRPVSAQDPLDAPLPPLDIATEPVATKPSALGYHRHQVEGRSASWSSDLDMEAHQLLGSVAQPEQQALLSLSPLAAQDLAPWTVEERASLLRMVHIDLNEQGYPNWEAIARYMPGRTVEACKAEYDLAQYAPEAAVTRKHQIASGSRKKRRHKKDPPIESAVKKPRTIPSTAIAKENLDGTKHIILGPGNRDPATREWIEMAKAASVIFINEDDRDAKARRIVDKLHAKGITFVANGSFEDDTRTKDESKPSKGGVSRFKVYYELLGEEGYEEAVKLTKEVFDREWVEFNRNVDVATGRGTMNNSPGNERCRNDAQARKVEYNALGKKQCPEKTAITKQVMNNVYARGGKFVTDENSIKGEYYRLSHKQARSKTSDLFRG